MRKLLLIALSMTILFLFTACSNVSQTNEDSETLGLNNGDAENISSLSNLDSWIGVYEFEETALSDIGGSIQYMEYSVKIYKDNDNYFAGVTIDGFQTMYRIKAEIKGDESSIDVVLLEYLPDSMTCIDIGSVLFSFEREDSKLLTCWGEIKPILIQNEESRKVYFHKVG